MDPELLAQFFRAAYAHVLDQLGKKATPDAVAKAAREALNDLTNNAGPVTWATAKRLTASQVKRSAALYNPARCVGFVVERSEPQIVTVALEDGQTEDVEAIHIKIEDRQGEHLNTLAIVGRHLVDLVSDVSRAGQSAEFLGVAVPMVVHLNGPQLFYFHVVDVRVSKCHLDLLGATDDERARAEQDLAELRLRDLPIIDSILDDLVQGLDVVALEEFPFLGQLLTFTILQALSCGSIGDSPARLHLMLVGPPGQGKKLIGLAARAMNPVCAELSGAKISLAGLIGASHLAAGGWKSTPGALARAANGVAVLQDAHAWRLSEVTKVAPVLQELIEDGVVRDTVAGGRTRQAPTSLVIDLNRTAQVGLAGMAKEAAIIRIRPLLSRVDLLAEIPADVGRSWGVGEKMYAKLGKRRALQPDWMRALQVAIATLRDRHPIIDLDDVTELMRQTHETIREKNRLQIEHMPEAGDIPVRLAITFARLVAAYARGSDRSRATADDVAKAAEFLRVKLDFLKMCGPDPVADPAAAPAKQSRADWVAHNAQTPVSPKNLKEQYEVETGNSVSEKTIKRDLENLGAKKVARGTFVVPPPERPDDNPEVDADSRVFSLPRVIDRAGSGKYFAGSEDEADDCANLPGSPDSKLLT